MVQLDVKRDHMLEVYGFVERNLSLLVTKSILTVVPVDSAHHPSKLATLETVRQLAREGCPIDNQSFIGRWCEQVKLTRFVPLFDFVVTRLCRHLCSLHLHHRHARIITTINSCAKD